MAYGDVWRGLGKLIASNLDFLKLIKYLDACNKIRWLNSIITALKTLQFKSEIIWFTG